MKALQFLRETKTEMKHVVWPTRRRALIYTVIIIVFSIGLGYILGGLDLLFQTILKTIVVK